MGLPVAMRLRRGPDITATVRGGRRARVGGLVVHGLRRAPGQDAGATGPRVAFVAPRAVGTAVVRNRTRRRVQAHLQALVATGTLPDEVDLVVRLLPSAGEDSYEDLGRSLHQALSRLGVLHGAHL
jgi:ribonuclease P protein component